MASAFQALPPPGPPPPGVVYPTTVTNQPSSHSNGSFGMVFVVLAIILVVSAVACVLGRLCNKRAQRGSNQPRANNSKYQNHGHDQRFREDERSHNLPPNGPPKERDVEFGFDKKTPKIKIVPREDGGRGQMMAPRNGEFGGPSMGNQMPPRNGEIGGPSMGNQMPSRNGEFGGPSMGNQMPPRNGEIGGPSMGNQMPPRNGEFGGPSMANQMPPRNGELGGRFMGDHMPRMMESPKNFR